jgi:ribosome maturation factor RimP
MQENAFKIDALDQLCRDVVEEAGFDLLLMEWKTDAGRQVLRLFIDHEVNGVNVDDCATVSRRLSHVLDVEEFIDVAYALEVSTPGLNRPLVRESDYVRFAGQHAKVTLKQPLPTGRKRLKGELKGVEAHEISMEVDGELFRFAVANVAQANLVYQGDI